MLLSMIAPLLLAAAQGPQPSSPDDDPPTPAEVEELAFDRDRYERMTVPVTIAGRGPYRFMVDTGSQATVVTPRIVEDLALQPDGQALVVGMGSSALVSTLTLDGLEFANRRLDNLRTPLLLDSHIGADGILGLDSLQDLRVLMDFREDRILVADARDLGGNSGYEIVVRARRKLGQMIITDARIGNIRVNVLIDTGTQRSFGNRALRERLRTSEHGTEIMTDVHGSAIENELRLARRLSIGGITLARLPIGFADSPTFAALGLENQPALVLGIGDLRAFRRVAIDFNQRRILFDLPGR
ncbi:aspartyl protease family protein [Qipengyuania spongiae]|uniref:Aspartyl protease family protein n=1 Tax=Qipengyuania spongiae TaxID=2909673 RepID=A0ABY5T2F4_9SPHN|nr:aspartyl protease family protein [Qipengyuania spongiae]UVI39456.1 aspartyl protease family protein [Qipengyuania spongiae]